MQLLLSSLQLLVALYLLQLYFLEKKVALTYLQVAVAGFWVAVAEFRIAVSEFLIAVAGKSFFIVQTKMR